MLVLDHSGPSYATMLVGDDVLLHFLPSSNEIVDFNRSSFTSQLVKVGCALAKVECAS